MIYEIAKVNGWICTDDEAEKRLESGEFIGVADFGKDEKLLVYVPYIPLLITDI